MLLNLLLEDVSNGLVSGGEEMVSQSDLLLVAKVWIMVDGRVQVKQYWQVERLVRVQELVLKAKALDFVEIQGALFREDLIDGDSCDGLV